MKKKQKKAKYDPIKGNIKFKKNGVVYNEGDTVEIVDLEGYTYKGTIDNLLSSQMYVRPPDSVDGKFFFYRGLKIRKV